MCVWVNVCGKIEKQEKAIHFSIGGAGLYLEDLVFVGLSSQTQPIEKHPSSIKRAQSPLSYAPLLLFFATCVMR